MWAHESLVRRLLATVGSVALVLAVPGAATGVGAVAAVPGAAASVATIVEIRTAHHPGFDRFVLEFDTRTAPRATVGLVSQLVGDFSGERVPVPGRAVIRVQVRDAQARTDQGEAAVVLDQAFALPNVMALRGAGDFEAVVTMGIGLAKRMPFHVHRLTNPGRIAIDVSTAFPRTTRRVTFMDKDARAGTSARVTVRRSVPDAYPATGLLDRVFAGPTIDEQAAGLRLVTSGATGFTAVSVSRGIARLRLTGGCAREASTFTIADSIIPTLRRLRTVDWVKIHHPAGQTQYPTGRRDSVPACLAATSGTCLYLVSQLSGTDPTVGSFLVLHVNDGVVTGTGGAFYSEWFSVRGRITDAGAALETQGESGSWSPLALTWVPAQGTFVGWTPVSAEAMRAYSGGGVPLRGQPCG
ncbi:MAG TPA: hypothetical protein VES03_01420 [Motilibacterales bacterium]|nr:hypothetical protein [Motilibacterales bacterium]